MNSYDNQCNTADRNCLHYVLVSQLVHNEQHVTHIVISDIYITGIQVNWHPASRF